MTLRERAERACWCADCQGLPPSDYNRCCADAIEAALREVAGEAAGVVQREGATGIGPATDFANQLAAAIRQHFELEEQPPASTR